MKNIELKSEQKSEGDEFLMGKRNINNRGFSLVELIITVAILAALIGVTGYGVSLVSGKPAEQCARKLAGALQHARTATMGKYRNVITVKRDSDGRLIVSEEYLIRIEDDDTEVTGHREHIVGAKGVTVKYETDNSGTYTDLAGDITLRFDSGSGALKKTTSTDGYYTSFEISKANKTYYVVIETLTGRITATTKKPVVP